MRFVLDADVVSKLRKIRLGKANTSVTAWAESVDAADLFISAITIMKLELSVLSIERKDATQGAMMRS
jgi:predicted nucleic acid-binding protein